MKFIRTKIVITTRPHKCAVCNGSTRIGEKCPTFTGIDGEGFFTAYFHDACWGHTGSHDWAAEDWED